MSKHVSVIYIKASQESVWQGLTSAEFTRQYWHQTDIESTWEPGSSVTFYNPDKSVAVVGIVLEADFPNKLSYTWHVHYNEQAKLETPSRVSFELETIADATRLTLVHDHFPEGTVLFEPIQQGWPAILSNLKTLIETDEVMAVS